MTVPGTSTPSAPHPARYRVAPRRRWQLTRIGAILGLFAFVVLGVIAVMNVDESGEKALPQLCAMVTVGLVVLGVALPFVIGRTRAVVRWPALLRKNEDANVLLGACRFVEAAEAYDAICDAARGTPIIHAVAVYNRGVTQLRQGDPEGAIALIRAAYDSGWHSIRLARDLSWQMANGLALAHAVAGDLETAAQWLERAQAAMGARPKRGALLPTEVYIDARAGRLEQAAARAEAGWALAEGTLDASNMRSLRLLVAFALASSGSPYRADGPQRAAPYLSGLRPLPSGALAYLSVRWPELTAFAKAHGLD